MRAAKWLGRAVLNAIVCYFLFLATLIAIVWGLPRLKTRADRAS